MGKFFNRDFWLIAMGAICAVAGFRLAEGDWKGFLILAGLAQVPNLLAARAERKEREA